MKDTGRKHHVYCNGWHPHHLLHEVTLTDEILPFWRIARRGFRCDKQLKPDAALFFGDTVVYCEMDMGTEGYEAKIEPQMDKYRRREAYNLWFAPSETRLNGIMAMGTEWSLYSVCGSGVCRDATGRTIPVEKLSALFNTRSA